MKEKQFKITNPFTLSKGGTRVIWQFWCLAKLLDQIVSACHGMQKLWAKFSSMRSRQMWSNWSMVHHCVDDWIIGVLNENLCEVKSWLLCQRRRRITVPSLQLSPITKWTHLVAEVRCWCLQQKTLLWAISSRCFVKRRSWRNGMVQTGSSGLRWQSSMSREHSLGKKVFVERMVLILSQKPSRRDLHKITCFLQDLWIILNLKPLHGQLVISDMWIKASFTHMHTPNTLNNGWWMKPTSPPSTLVLFEFCHWNISPLFKSMEEKSSPVDIS